MVSYCNAVAMFPAPNRHAPHHASQTPYFAYGYPQQTAAQYVPNMNMGELNCNLQQFPMTQFGSPDGLQHHQAASGSWHNPSVYPMSAPLPHHTSSCARNTVPYEEWSLHAQQSQSPHSPSPCSQHMASPSPQHQQQGSQSPTLAPVGMYPHYGNIKQQPTTPDFPSCSQPQDLSSGAQCLGAAPSGGSSSATITATAIATVTASAASPADSGLAVSSDGVSSSDSPHQHEQVAAAGAAQGQTQQQQQQNQQNQQTGQQQSATSAIPAGAHHPHHTHPLTHTHPHATHHGLTHHGPPSGALVAAAAAAARPQPVRSPYEWMKKPSYQNQPNPGKTRTKDKYRVVYTDHQRLELEKEFHYSRYITIRRKSELAAMLGLSERQVKIWFQNRRAKERKQTKKREELLQKEKIEAVTKMQAVAVAHAAAAAAAAAQHNGLVHKME